MVSTDSSISGISSTGKIANRLLLDNEGVRFTRCWVENPPDRQILFRSGQLVREVRHPAGPFFLLALLPVHLQIVFERRICSDNPCRSVLTFCNGSTGQVRPSS